MAIDFNDNRYCNYVSISPTGLCIYRQALPGMFCNYRNIEENSGEKKHNRPPRFKTPNGIMSKRARRRLSRALKWLLYLSRTKRQYSKQLKKWVPFRLNFITLTLASPQIHDDNTIKKELLHQFLVEMRRAVGMKDYIWRAEKQLNGNIHFHLVTNTWIDYRNLRARWNRIQNKLGYIDRYAEKQSREIKSFTDYYNKYRKRASYTKLLNSYNENMRTKWRSPNSVDVRSTRRIKNLEAYLSKYLCKDISKQYKTPEDIPEKLLVSGKLWGLSNRLSKLRSASSELTSKVNEEISKLFSKMRVYVYNSDFFTWLSIPLKAIYKHNCIELIWILENYLNEVGYNILVPD